MTSVGLRSDRSDKRTPVLVLGRRAAVPVLSRMVVVPRRDGAGSKVKPASGLRFRRSRHSMRMRRADRGTRVFPGERSAEEGAPSKVGSWIKLAGRTSNANKGDPLVAERGDDLELATECLDVLAQRRQLPAISPLKAR